MPKREWWIPAVGLFAACFLAYLPALQAGFIWDDDRYVTNNPLLHNLSGLWDIWFSTKAPSQYVPMVYTSFWIEHALWSLFAPGYHFVNVLLHATNAVLLWRLLRRLAVPGAWLAAAIFALHPVHVESVAWISERKNVLSLLFSLLALRAWIEFVAQPDPVSRAQYRRCLVFYVLALLSKATACTLPAAMLLLLWWQQKSIDRQRLLQLLPFVLIGLAMGFWVMWWERFHQGTEGELFALGLPERFLVAARALWFYLGKLVCPVNLAFIYPQWKVSASDPAAYLGLIASVAAALLIARSKLERGIKVAALFFVAMLGPLLGFIMLYTFRYTFVADHYQYVASIGPLALAAAAIWAGLDRPALRQARLFVCTVLLLVLGTLTWQQARVYRDKGTLWQDVLKKNPACWMAENNLGNWLLQQGRADEAMTHYLRALELKPDYPEAHYNLANVLARQGQADNAAEHLQTAVRFDPKYTKAHHNLGTLLLGAGKFEEAISHFEKALELQPRLTAARVNLAVALNRLNRKSEAIAQLRQALTTNPNDFEAQHFLQELLVNSKPETNLLKQMPESPSSHQK
jgi:tetratricopeptide (TPR) repeat protein